MKADPCFLLPSDIKRKPESEDSPKVCLLCNQQSWAEPCLTFLLWHLHSLAYTSPSRATFRCCICRKCTCSWGCAAWSISKHECQRCWRFLMRFPTTSGKQPKRVQKIVSFWWRLHASGTSQNLATIQVPNLWSFICATKIFNPSIQHPKLAWMILLYVLYFELLRSWLWLKNPKEL